MACAGIQTTLPPTDRDLAHFAQSLGLVRLAAWHALERSTSAVAPLSTSTALTQSLFRQLMSLGVLRVPLGHEPDTRRALYEPLTWCYCTDWGDPSLLQLTLQATLQELSARPDSLGAKLELWETLANAETETYLSHLLRRHTFDPAAAGYIMHAMADEWSVHCLARRRYLIWFGIRGAAAALLRMDMDQDAARHAMLEEMRRRSRWLASKAAAQALAKDEYCFVPDPQWKRPVLLETFLTLIHPIGQAYWTERPRASWDSTKEASCHD